MSDKKDRLFVAPLEIVATCDCSGMGGCVITGYVKLVATEEEKDRLQPTLEDGPVVTYGTDEVTVTLRDTNPNPANTYFYDFQISDVEQGVTKKITAQMGIVQPIDGELDVQCL